MILLGTNKIIIGGVNAYLAEEESYKLKNLLKNLFQKSRLAKNT